MDRDQTRQQEQYQGDRFDDGQSSMSRRGERGYDRPAPATAETSLDRPSGGRAGSGSAWWSRTAITGPATPASATTPSTTRVMKVGDNEGEAPSSGFDQRNVRYGQGQGDGAGLARRPRAIPAELATLDAARRDIDVPTNGSARRSAID